MSSFISTFSFSKNLYQYLPHSHGENNPLVSPNSDEKYFRISPNPFQTEIKIINPDYDNDILYEIYDLNGRLVKPGNSSVNKSIKIDNIMNGIYFIKIKFDNKIETHRIIKN